MSLALDPLAGLARPGGDTAGLGAMASSYASGSESLGRTTRGLVSLADRVMGQSWRGAAATACAGQCARDGGSVGLAARAWGDGAAVLRRFADRLGVAQGDFDAARRLAEHAVAEEQQHDRISQFRATARARAERAVGDAKAAAREAAAALDQTMAAREGNRAPAPRAGGAARHWYAPGEHFLGGAWDGVKDPGVMLGGLVGLRGDVSDNWSVLGSGLAHGLTHPSKLGKAVIGWDDLSRGHITHWAGELVPAAAAALVTGGAAVTLKGGKAVTALNLSERGLAEAAEVGLSSRGLRPAWGTRIRPAGVPKNWRVRGTTSDGGVRYFNPANRRDAVRVMQGNPNSLFATSRSAYVRWQREGRSLDAEGRILPSPKSSDAHIPLADFVFRPEMFR